MVNPKFPLTLVLLTLLALPAFAADAPDDPKPADIANMKAIGAALNAFKNAKGEFPEHLSDLVPDFLDAKTLLSPGNNDADPHAAKGEYDPKLPCSYAYEFSTDLFKSLSDPNQKLTVRQVRAPQLQDFGPTVPILRCYLYSPKVLSLTHGGELFESGSSWETSEEGQSLLKKNGLGPGPQTGKKLIVHLTDAEGHPVAGIPLQVGGRMCSGVMLANREIVADAQGQVTVPLGTDAKPSASFRCLHHDWFLLNQYWTWGAADTPADGETASTTVRLIPAKPIGGIIRDPKGAPLGGVFILLGRISPSNPDFFDGIEGAKTDESGAWSFPSCPLTDVEVVLRVIPQDYRWVEGAPGTHGVPDLATLSSGAADIRLLPPFTLKGVVRSGDKPVPNARVCMLGGKLDATTDADGRFEMPTKREGKVTFFVTAENFAPLDEDVVVTADVPAPFTLVMDAGRPLQGRLVSGPHGAIPNTPIVLSWVKTKKRDSSGPLITQPVIAVTDADGRFTWAHAPKGNVGCRALLADGEPCVFMWDTTKNDEKIVTVNR